MPDGPAAGDDHPTGADLARPCPHGGLPILQDHLMLPARFGPVNLLVEGFFFFSLPHFCSLESHVDPFDQFCIYLLGFVV